MQLDKFLRSLKNRMKDSTYEHSEGRLSTVAFLVKYESAWLLGMLISSSCAALQLDND